MPALRIGLDLQTLQMPFREALHTAARLGVDAVVLDARQTIRPNEFTQTGVRELRKVLEDLHLRVAALSYRSRRGLVTMDELDHRVTGTKAAMDLAYRLGSDLVIGTLGPLPQPESEAWQVLTTVLDDLGSYSQRAGAVFAAQTGLDTGDAFARLLRSLPEGALGVDFNPGDLVIAGHNPREAVQALGSWILHVHATDAIAGFSQSRGRRVPLGQGAVDTPALLGALEEFGYRRYFTVQPNPGDEAVRHATTAVQYLRSL